MSHSCKNLIIHCIDFRFIQALQQFMQNEELIGDCDVIALAGAGKNIVSPEDESEKNVFLSQVDISKKLHRVSKMYVVQHMDCGAFGGHTAFASLEEEIHAQKEVLAQGKVILEERYLDVAVIKILAHITHDGAVTFEKVA
jgi:carbonic anhydrase